MKKIFILFFIFLLLNSKIYGDESLVQVKQQLKRIEREITDLQKELYSNNTKSSSSSVIQSNSSEITVFDMRLRDIEKELQNINLNYENLYFEIEDLKKGLNDLSLNLNSAIITFNNQTKGLTNQSNENLSVSDQNDHTLGTIIIGSNEVLENNVEDKPEEQNISYSSPEEQFQEAFGYLRNQRFEKAETALKSFIEDNPSHRLSGSAYYWLGELYLLQKEYREAALFFAEGYQKYPDSVKSPDNLYKLAQAYMKIEKKEEACDTFDHFLKKYENHNLVGKIKLNINNLQCT